MKEGVRDGVFLFFIKKTCIFSTNGYFCKPLVVQIKDVREVFLRRNEGTMKDSSTKMDKNTIRENLRNARVSLGLSQADVAEDIGISVTAYQKIENGKTRILNDNFSKCANVFGMSLSELVNGFVPIKNADVVLTDVKEKYGLKMKIQENDFRSELQEKNREIERLKGVIKDKEDTIAAQKLLIGQLIERNRD